MDDGKLVVARRGREAVYPYKPVAPAMVRAVALEGPASTYIRSREELRLSTSGQHSADVRAAQSSTAETSAVSLDVPTTGVSMFRLWLLVVTAAHLAQGNTAHVAIVYNLSIKLTSD